jgi:hypothetical protein
MHSLGNISFPIYLMGVALTKLQQTCHLSLLRGNRGFNPLHYGAGGQASTLGLTV